jgi:hypothetical protein
MDGFIKVANTNLDGTTCLPGPLPEFNMSAAIQFEYRAPSVDLYLPGLGECGANFRVSL